MSSPELIFPFSQSDRDAFVAADSPLITRWAKEYDFLFDDIDIRTARNQAPIRKSGWGGYHFYEWLAAILIYRATGMWSLVEGYQGQKHERKQRTLDQLLTNEQRSLILADRTYKAGAPDLLVYAPDYSSFFFCEVKGPGDTVKPKPAEFFRAIESACGKPVVIARFIRREPLLSVRT